MRGGDGQCQGEDPGCDLEVGVAERGGGDADEELMGAGRGDGEVGGEVGLVDWIGEGLDGFGGEKRK